MKSTPKRVLLLVATVVVLALALAACGGGGSSTGSGSTEAAETAETAVETTASEGTGAGSGADLAAAEKLVAPYIGHPSAFPVTEPLKEVPQGATVAFMDCGTPICAVSWELIAAAAEAMGINSERVKAGESANTVSAAFDTVIQNEPDAVIVGGIPIELWSNKLDELEAKDIHVLTGGVADAEKYGIEAPQGSTNVSELEGSLLAGYALTQMTGEETDAVFYETPELTFTTTIGEAFKSELEALCSSCSVRIAKVSASELGNTAPNTVVSDLQANPETNLTVFGTAEIAAGLFPALQTAGIEVETLGNFPGPSELQYIKEGKLTAGLAVDFAVYDWGLVDQAAREIVGQKITGLQAEGLPVLQFLTKEDVQYDVSKGWSGYPDFAERFAKLWGVKG